MLIWQQTKYIRSLKKKGQTPSWYLKLEQKVLKEGRSREVKDAYRIKKINEKAIKIRPKRIAQDRRKKKQFLFKKNNELQLGKVIRKTEKIIVAEHWKKEPTQEPESETFTRCKSCNGKNFNNRLV